METKTKKDDLKQEKERTDTKRAVQIYILNQLLTLRYTISGTWTSKDPQIEGLTEQRASLAGPFEHASVARDGKRHGGIGCLYIELAQEREKIGIRRRVTDDLESACFHVQDEIKSKKG